MAGERVVAVVVTHNRRAMLVDCLKAIERQTHRPDEVVVVDSASTDGTDALLGTSTVVSRVPLAYLRLKRNGGGAEGFHYGVRAAFERESDWLWLMDDDCLPAVDALERLLAGPHARDPRSVVLAPVVRDPAGAVLPLHRGTVRKRFFFAPLVALPLDRYAGDATRIDFCSFVGPLVRTAAARRIGLPRREAFIRFEDIEYVSRFRRDELKWLVPAGVVVHREAEPVTGSDLRSHWRDYSRRIPFSEQWKRLYGFRNLIFCGVQGGYIGRAQWASYFAVQAVRTLLFHERRALTLWLLVLYGYDGWRGRFRNVPPGSWRGVAAARRPVQYVNRAALRYDEDSRLPARATPPRAHATATGP